MMKNRIALFLIICTVIFNCTSQKNAGDTNETISADSLSDDSLLTLVQYRTFQYFWAGAEPTSGAARERFHADHIYPDDDKHSVTSGGTGFGVMAIRGGIERKFITRHQGFQRLDKLINWLEK